MHRQRFPRDCFPTRSNNARFAQDGCEGATSAPAWWHHPCVVSSSSGEICQAGEVCVWGSSKPCQGEKTQIHRFGPAPRSCLPCPCSCGQQPVLLHRVAGAVKIQRFWFPLFGTCSCDSSVPSACPPAAPPPDSPFSEPPSVNKSPRSFPHPTGPGSGTRVVPAGWNNYLYLCYYLWNNYVYHGGARLLCLGLCFLLGSQALVRDPRSPAHPDPPTTQLVFSPKQP